MREIYDEITEMFERCVKEAEASAQSNAADEEEIFRAKALAIKGFYNDLKKHVAWIENNYRKELHVRKEYFPRQWMLDDKKIAEVFERFRICDVLNYLDKNYGHM